MAERVQKQAPTKRDTKESPPEQKKASERGEELKATMDALLDEIDSVLEEDAEAFVKQYVQKGGQ